MQSSKNTDLYLEQIHGIMMLLFQPGKNQTGMLIIQFSHMVKILKWDIQFRTSNLLRKSSVISCKLHLRNHQVIQLITKFQISEKMKILLKLKKALRLLKKKIITNSIILLKNHGNHQVLQYQILVSMKILLILNITLNKLRVNWRPNSLLLLKNQLILQETTLFQTLELIVIFFKLTSLEKLLKKSMDINYMERILHNLKLNLIQSADQEDASQITKKSHSDIQLTTQFHHLELTQIFQVLLKTLM